MSLVDAEPPPIPQPDLTPTWDLVIEDLRRAFTDPSGILELVIADARERDGVGRVKYGTPLTSHNGRDSLLDAYQEAQDLAVYLRNELEEGGERFRDLMLEGMYDDALAMLMRIRRLLQAKQARKKA